MKTAAFMTNRKTRTYLLSLACRLGLLGWLYCTAALMAVGSPALLARVVADQWVPADGQRSQARTESDDDDDGDVEAVTLHAAAGLPRRSERGTPFLPLLPSFCRPAARDLSAVLTSSSQARPAPFHDGAVPPLRC
jgi:hypothetical protein